MGKLINIDNGGTLTDVIVIDGDNIHRAKTITTPEDLSQCFFEGLREVSKAIYGEENLSELLYSADFIRYSTTEGTNALVQRRGPRLGLIVNEPAMAARVWEGAAQTDLAAVLVGGRVAVIPDAVGDEDRDDAIVEAVNALTYGGANRIVVSLSGDRYVDAEKYLKHVALHRFPPHMLGTVPMLYSHEVVDAAEDVTRTWTALINAFLHPAMETFLYHAEQRLREYHLKTPLLIFRNDGGSARVAKTKAIKSYSSGPRGGIEGVRALACHYGLADVVSIDIGGTTTDVGQIAHGTIHTSETGLVNGIPIAFPLAALTSLGIGGGSVIRAEGRDIVVGPESTGAVPGPACFGRGGGEATITDVMLARGILDASSFFGGKIKLDTQRAAAVADSRIGQPLGLNQGEALIAMTQAWIKTAADGIRGAAAIDRDTVLAVFGGAGPLLICGVAEQLGVRRILIPGTAAVFSAIGIGFSDLSQEYQSVHNDAEPATLSSALDRLKAQAARDMYAEGIELEDCQLEAVLRQRDHGAVMGSVLDLDAPAAPSAPGAGVATIVLRVAKTLAHPPLRTGTAKTHAPAPAGERVVLLDEGARTAVPVYRVEALKPGACVAGSAIVEDAYFTSLIGEGWTVEINVNHDIWLRRAD